MTVYGHDEVPFVRGVSAVPAVLLSRLAEPGPVSPALGLGQQSLDEPESPRLNCLGELQAVLALKSLDQGVRIA